MLILGEFETNGKTMKKDEDKGNRETQAIDLWIDVKKREEENVIWMCWAWKHPFPLIAEGLILTANSYLTLLQSKHCKQELETSTITINYVIQSDFGLTVLQHNDKNEKKKNGKNIYTNKNKNSMIQETTRQNSFYITLYCSSMFGCFVLCHVVVLAVTYTENVTVDMEGKKFQ